MTDSVIAVLFVFIPITLKYLPLFVPPVISTLSPSLNPSFAKSIPEVVGTLNVEELTVTSSLVILKLRDSAAKSKVIPDALASTVSE